MGSFILGGVAFVVAPSPVALVVANIVGVVGGSTLGFLGGRDFGIVGPCPPKDLQVHRGGSTPFDPCRAHFVWSPPFLPGTAGSLHPHVRDGGPARAGVSGRSPECHRGPNHWRSQEVSRGSRRGSSRSDRVDDLRAADRDRILRRRKAERGSRLGGMSVETRNHTADPGASDLNEAAWVIDRTLVEIQSEFEFLTLLAPNNVDQAWEGFRSSGFERAPNFEYPSIEIDPDALRRRLARLDLEPVEDPGLLYFLAVKIEELDKELGLVAARNTSSFLPRSMGLFGPVQHEYLHEAERLLESLDPDEPPRTDEVLDARECRRLVEEEFDHYHEMDTSFSARIEVRPEQAGFMAEGRDLFIPGELSLAPGRARAFIQHEVGVHIVTWHNGSKQPLGLLTSGLSSYDELQEGFGTLAEYVVGGLTADRMRDIAARVVAVKMTEERTHFVDIFRRLVRDYGFGEYHAFDVTSRVHSCGGFTRDQIYLRGLIYLLRYLHAGGALEPLYLGKVGHEEIPVVQDLGRRGVLREPPLKPRFLEIEGAEDALAAVRRGIQPRDLVRKPGSPQEARRMDVKAA